MADRNFLRRYGLALAQGSQESRIPPPLGQELQSVTSSSPERLTSESINHSKILATSSKVGICPLSENPSGQEGSSISLASTRLIHCSTLSSDLDNRNTTEAARILDRKPSSNSIWSSRSSSFQSAKSFQTTQSRKPSKKSIRRLPSFLGRYHTEQEHNLLSCSFPFASTRELHSTAWTSSRYRVSNLARPGIPTRTASLSSIQEANVSRRLQSRSISVNSTEELAELLSTHNEPLFIDLAKRADREFIFPVPSATFIEAAPPLRHRAYRSSSYDALGHRNIDKLSTQASTPLIYNPRSSVRLHCRRIREPVFVPKTILKSRAKLTKMDCLSVGDATVEGEQGSLPFAHHGHKGEETNGTTGAENGGSAEEPVGAQLEDDSSEFMITPEYYKLQPASDPTPDGADGKPKIFLYKGPLPHPGDISRDQLTSTASRKQINRRAFVLDICGGDEIGGSNAGNGFSTQADQAVMRPSSVSESEGLNTNTAFTSHDHRRTTKERQSGGDEIAGLNYETRSSSDEIRGSNDEIVDSNDRTGISNDEAVDSNDRTGISNDEAVDSNDRTSISNDEAVASNDRTSISNDEAVASNDRTSISNDEAVNSNDRTGDSNDRTGDSSSRKGLRNRARSVYNQFTKPFRTRREDIPKSSGQPKRREKATPTATPTSDHATVSFPYMDATYSAIRNIDGLRMNPSNSNGT